MLGKTIDKTRVFCEENASKFHLAAVIAAATLGHVELSRRGFPLVPSLVIGGALSASSHLLQAKEAQSAPKTIGASAAYLAYKCASMALMRLLCNDIKVYSLIYCTTTFAEYFVYKCLLAKEIVKSEKVFLLSLLFQGIIHSATQNLIEQTPFASIYTAFAEKYLTTWSGILCASGAPSLAGYAISTALTEGLYQAIGHSLVEQIGGLF